MRLLKQTLDPKGILNAGRIFEQGATQHQAPNMRNRWRDSDLFSASGSTGRCCQNQMLCVFDFVSEGEITPFPSRALLIHG